MTDKVETEQTQNIDIVAEPTKETVAEKENETTIEESNPITIVDNDTNTAIDKIVKAETQDEFDSLLSVFNLAQSKKKVLRMLQYSNLLDAATEEAVKRIKDNPNEATSKDLLDCINIISTQLDKSEQSFKPVATGPTIQVNQTKTTINVDMPQYANYTQDEKTNIIDVVTHILELAKQTNTPQQTIDNVVNNDDNNVIVAETTDSKNETTTEPLVKPIDTDSTILGEQQNTNNTESDNSIENINTNGELND